MCHHSLVLLQQRIYQIVAGCASEFFAFYSDRGECENRIEEFKNGFHADRLSCHRFLANAFRLLLHGFAYNLVNLFRLLQLPQAWRSAQIETLRARLFKLGARVRQTARCMRPPKRFSVAILRRTKKLSTPWQDEPQPKEEDVHRRDGTP